MPRLSAMVRPSASQRMATTSAARGAQHSHAGPCLDSLFTVRPASESSRLYSRISAPFTCAPRKHHLVRDEYCPDVAFAEHSNPIGGSPHPPRTAPAHCKRSYRRFLVTGHNGQLNSVHEPPE